MYNCFNYTIKIKFLYVRSKLVSVCLQQFNKAVEDVKNLEAKPSDDELLEIYALFKQSSVGDCNTGLYPTRADIVKCCIHMMLELYYKLSSFLESQFIPPSVRYRYRAWQKTVLAMWSLECQVWLVASDLINNFVWNFFLNSSGNNSKWYLVY